MFTLQKVYKNTIKEKKTCHHWYSILYCILSIHTKVCIFLYIIIVPFINQGHIIWILKQMFPNIVYNKLLCFFIQAVKILKEQKTLPFSFSKNFFKYSCYKQLNITLTIDRTPLLYNPEYQSWVPFT